MGWEAQARLVELMGQINCLTAQVVHVIAEVLEADAWGADGGLRSPEHWVAWRTGVAPARAAALVAVKPRLRVVIEERDRGCRYPGCSQQRWVHVHHLVHREDGGLTIARNLIRLCPFHHRLHHQGAFNIEGDPESSGLRFMDRWGHEIGPPHFGPAAPTSFGTQPAFAPLGAHVGDDHQYLALFEGAGEGAADHNYLSPGVNHFGFVVDDLDDARERAPRLGAAIHLEGSYEPGRRIYLFDPDGHEVELVEYWSERQAVDPLPLPWLRELCEHLGQVGGQR